MPYGNHVELQCECFYFISQIAFKRHSIALMQKIVKFNRAFLYCCMVVMLCLHPLFTRSEPLQGKPLTISIKNTSLAEVLRQVSKKSGVYIYFQDADLASYPN